MCVCAIAATTVVNTHLANFDDDSALANFDLGSAVDDDSAFDGDSAFDDELALADFDDNSDDDNPEGAQLGQTGNICPSYVKRNIPKWGGRWPLARGFRHSGSPTARNPKACEEKCNQNGDCIGFSDYRGVCYFARTRGDWYAKPNIQ